VQAFGVAPRSQRAGGVVGVAQIDQPKGVVGRQHGIDVMGMA
jgi:hypothetical protein